MALGTESRPDKLFFPVNVKCNIVVIIRNMTDITNLDFIAPVTLTIGAKDGNDASQQNSDNIYTQKSFHSKWIGILDSLERFLMLLWC
jgi:hypothetical protein